jgi:hypothetical protein
MRVVVTSHTIAAKLHVESNASFVSDELGFRNLALGFSAQLCNLVDCLFLT